MENTFNSAYGIWTEWQYSSNHLSSVHPYSICFILQHACHWKALALTSFSSSTKLHSCYKIITLNLNFFIHFEGFIFCFSLIQSDDHFTCLYYLVWSSSFLFKILIWSFINYITIDSITESNFKKNSVNLINSYYKKNFIFQTLFIKYNLILILVPFLLILLRYLHG